MTDLVRILEAREAARLVPFGGTIKCAFCGTEVRKNSYQKMFCGSKCRGAFWDAMNTRGSTLPDCQADCWVVKDDNVLMKPRRRKVK